MYRVPPGIKDSCQAPKVESTFFAGIYIYIYAILIEFRKMVIDPQPVTHTRVRIKAVNFPLTQDRGDPLHFSGNHNAN